MRAALRRRLRVAGAAPVYCDDGVVYHPWSNGWAIGFEAVRAGERASEFVYLNPSGGSDDGQPTVFLYQGMAGDPSEDTPRCHLDVLPPARTPTQSGTGAPPRTFASSAISAAEQAFAALGPRQRDRLLRGVFDVLEYDEDGRPGSEWSSDTTQALGDLFGAFGIVFTSPDAADVRDVVTSYADDEGTEVVSDV